MTTYSYMGPPTMAGHPIDGATVSVGALETARTDGKGFRVVRLIPATVGGTGYSVTYSESGYHCSTCTGETAFSCTWRFGDEDVP